MFSLIVVYDRPRMFTSIINAEWCLRRSTTTTTNIQRYWLFINIINNNTYLFRFKISMNSSNISSFSLFVCNFSIPNHLYQHYQCRICRVRYLLLRNYLYVCFFSCLKLRFTLFCLFLIKLIHIQIIIQQKLLAHQRHHPYV